LSHLILQFGDDNTTTNLLDISPQEPMPLRAVFARSTGGYPTTLYIDTYGSSEVSDIAWNMVDFGGANTLSGLIAADGRGTPVNVTVTEPFLTAALGGAASATLTGAAAEFNAARLGSATNRQYYGGTSMGVPGVGDLTKVVARVTGLTPGNAYAFTFVGSRNVDSAYSCTTLYRAIGANTRSDTLITRFNSTNVATVPDIVADADGGITLEISDENDTVGEAFYLLAFKIEGVVEHLSPNILWYGNSFTSMGDIPGKVAELAELAGYERPYCYTQIGEGMPVAWHTNRLAAAPEQSVDHITGTGRWDYVVLQGYPIEACSAITSSPPAYVYYPYRPLPAEGFIPDSIVLVDRVRSASAGGNSKTILYETWPLAEGFPAFYPDRMASPAVMEEETRANYAAVQAVLKDVYGRDAAAMANVGEAFGRLDFDTDLYNADLIHAGPLGQTLSAMVLFSEIYDVDMKDSGVTWEVAYAVGWTTANETEWNALVKAADYVRAPKGLIITIR
jgi:hypothetical protein